MIPLLGAALLFLLLAGSSKAGAAGSSDTSLPADVAKDVVALKGENATFASALLDTLKSGNPYFLVQYVSGLATHPALGTYVANLVIKALSGPNQTWTGKSGAIYKSWDVTPSSPITFTGPKGQSFTATPEWNLTYLLLNPGPNDFRPLLVYAEKGTDKSTRKLLAVAPGMSDAQINTGRSDFAVNDAGVFA